MTEKEKKVKTGLKEVLIKLREMYDNTTVPINVTHEWLFTIRDEVEMMIESIEEMIGENEEEQDEMQ
jgi:hypothetical protein